MRSLLFSLVILSSLNLFAERAAVTPINVSGDIMGFELSRSGLTLQVASGGCISKKDFEIRQLESFPPQISIVQVGKDFCEAYLPYGKKLTFSYEELGIGENAPVQVDLGKSMIVRATR